MKIVERFRATHPALGPRHKQLARCELVSGGDVLLLTRRAPGGAAVQLVGNLTGRDQRVPELGTGRSILIDTAESRFGGRDSRPLGPYQASLYE